MSPVDVFGGPGEARDLLTHTIGGDPFERIEALRKAGERKARAEGLAYQMEHERKHLLALYASEYAEVHAKEKLSEARLERMARSDDRYRKHIEGTAAAIEERELARSEYWRIQAELTWMEKTVAHANAMSRLENP